MKLKLLSLICVGTIGLGTATPAVAATDPDEAFFDAVLGRPVGLAATVVGGAIFVVSLPFTAASGSIKSSAHSLVGKPAKFTFGRHLGDFRYPEQRHQQHPVANKATPQQPVTHAQTGDQSKSL